jgi:hypothetical protein
MTRKERESSASPAGWLAASAKLGLALAVRPPPERQEHGHERQHEALVHPPTGGPQWHSSGSEWQNPWTPTDVPGLSALADRRACYAWLSEIWLNQAMGPEGFEPPTLSFEGSCSIH